jgi:hypothetical protein
MHTFCLKNILWLGALSVVVLMIGCFLYLWDAGDGGRYGGVVANKPADFAMPVLEETAIIEADKDRTVAEESSPSLTSASTLRPKVVTATVSPKTEAPIQAGTLYKVDPGFGGGIPPKRDVVDVESSSLKFCDEL